MAQQGQHSLVFKRTGEGDGRTMARGEESPVCGRRRKRDMWRGRSAETPRQGPASRCVRFHPASLPTPRWRCVAHLLCVCVRCVKGSVWSVIARWLCGCFNHTPPHDHCPSPGHNPRTRWVSRTHLIQAYDYEKVHGRACASLGRRLAVTLQTRGACGSIGFTCRFHPPFLHLTTLDMTPLILFSCRCLVTGGESVAYTHTHTHCAGAPPSASPPPPPPATTYASLMGPARAADSTAAVTP